MGNINSPQIIAVDLDGTITLTDTFHESVIALIRNKPLFLLLLPLWLARGIAFLKLKVAENTLLDVTILPYNFPFIDWLREQKASGKTIILCTAANESIALAVAKHLNIFDDVIASNANTNLKSAKKRRALEEKYGERGFDYAGNSAADVEVWAGACHAIVVNASSALHTKMTRIASVSHTFPSESVRLSHWCKALRVHQWVKNLLLFVPILAAHHFGNVQSLTTLLIAFMSFSLCASSVYIINDLLDLESDRQHLRKKNRPFASAKLTIAVGIAIVPLLISLSIALGVMVGKDFLIVLILYFLITIAYSLVFKYVVLVDCLILASLYTVRIIAGAAAASLSLSFWLLSFSIFIFLSLALVKRYAELMVQDQAGKSFMHGRGYIISDASLLQTFGVSSGYISALVFALYMRSEDILSLYVKPTAIWLFLPILLFWVSWVWLKASRGEMHDDPIIFAAKDKASLIVAVLTTLVFAYAATGFKT
jgi:4-hydroxybenzoate polyprenyltransferase